MQRADRCSPTARGRRIAWRASVYSSANAPRRMRVPPIGSTLRVSRRTRWRRACRRWWAGAEAIGVGHVDTHRESSGSARSTMTEVMVDLGPRSYAVTIGVHLLGEIGPRLAAAGFRGKCGLVTSERVTTLYGEPVIDSLQAAGFQPTVVAVPDGEEHKNLAWLAVLYARLLEARIERRSPV